MLTTTSDGSFSNSEGKDLLPLLLEILFDLWRLEKLEHHDSSYSEAPYVHLRPEGNVVYTREKTRKKQRERER